MTSLPTYIDAEDVKAIIEKKEPGMTIIDVRDDDFFEGHIRGAWQVPSGKFSDESQIDKLIERLPEDTDTVVLHCQLSQVRGPKCARRLAERLADPAWRKQSHKPQVKVMRYGYDGFYNKFHSTSPQFFEDGRPPVDSST